MRHLFALGICAVLLSACGPTLDTSLDGGDAPGVSSSTPRGSGPQYEPGDPCKGVVPQMCAV